MPGLLWKLVTSPSEKASSEIIKEAIRTRLLWEKPKEERRKRSWFWSRGNEEPAREPEPAWGPSPKEKKGLFE